MRLYRILLYSILFIPFVYFNNSISSVPQVAVPDVVEAAKDADILVFVVPHQFIVRLCSQLLGKIKPDAVGLSLIKVSFS
jgi:Glycerol-3-phosphate dehydrogenase